MRNTLAVNLLNVVSVPDHSCQIRSHHHLGVILASGIFGEIGNVVDGNSAKSLKYFREVQRMLDIVCSMRRQYVSYALRVVFYH